MNYQYNNIFIRNRGNIQNPYNIYQNQYNQRFNYNYNKNYNQYPNYQNQNYRSNDYNNNSFLKSYYSPQLTVRSLSSNYERQNQNNYYNNKPNNNYKNLQKTKLQNLTLYNFQNKNNGNTFVNSSYNIVNSYSTNNIYQRNPLNYFNNITYQKPYNNQYKKNINLDDKNSQIYNNIYSKEKISIDHLSEYYERNCSAVKEYSYKEVQNSQFRNYMEDKGKSIDFYNNNPYSALFCLFDGHGGKQVSSYLQLNFPIFFKKILNNINEITIRNLFIEIDEKIKEHNYYNVGSTANIIYITKENNKRILYGANVGDTRSILISNNEVKRLSYDDRASDINEYNRIINNGGIVFRGRVYGTLMLSRAFGDWELKNYGVICHPHFCKVELNNYDKYIVIASDGIWDVLNDKDLYNFNCNVSNSKDFCDLIIQESLKRGSTDNLSCFVIKV